MISWLSVEVDVILDGSGDVVVIFWVFLLMEKLLSEISFEVFYLFKDLKI